MSPFLSLYYLPLFCLLALWQLFSFLFYCVRILSVLTCNLLLSPGNESASWTNLESCSPVFPAKIYVVGWSLMMFTNIGGKVAQSITNKSCLPFRVDVRFDVITLSLPSNIIFNPLFGDDDDDGSSCSSLTHALTEESARKLIDNKIIDNLDVIHNDDIIQMSQSTKTCLSTGECLWLPWAMCNSEPIGPVTHPHADIVSRHI